MSVTLYANDSVSLTTGVVTRSTTDTRGDAMIRRNQDFRTRILADSKSRIRRNDLSALAFVIRQEMI